jgi:hypothetical protein
MSGFVYAYLSLNLNERSYSPVFLSVSAKRLPPGWRETVVRSVQLYAVIERQDLAAPDN